MENIPTIPWFYTSQAVPFTLWLRILSLPIHLFLTRRTLDAANKCLSQNHFTTSREKYRAVVFKKHWRWTLLKTGQKKILIYLQAPHCKYTASTHSRSLPHITALFCRPVNLTWSNHILGGREGIQLPRSLIPGPPLSTDEHSL